MYVHIYSDILSDILSRMYSDILSGIISGIYSDILSGMYSDILSGIKFWHSFWHSIWHLFAFILAFYLASILAFCLTFLLAIYLAFFLEYTWVQECPAASGARDRVRVQTCPTSPHPELAITELATWLGSVHAEVRRVGRRRRRRTAEEVEEEEEGVTVKEELHLCQNLERETSPGRWGKYFLPVIPPTILTSCLASLSGMCSGSCVPRRIWSSP